MYLQKEIDSKNRGGVNELYLDFLNLRYGTSSFWRLRFCALKKYHATVVNSTINFVFVLSASTIEF